MMVQIEKNFFYFNFSLFIIFFSIILINYIHPDALNNILWKLNSFFEIDINALTFTSLSAVTRYIETLNIFINILTNILLLLGSGFGSYFTDIYIPFHFNLYGVCIPR